MIEKQEFPNLRLVSRAQSFLNILEEMYYYQLFGRWGRNGEEWDEEEPTVEEN